MVVEAGVIRRKLAASRVEAAEGGPGADRGWRLALARAARDQMKLPLEVAGLALSRVGLADVLEAPHGGNADHWPGWQRGCGRA